MKKPNILIVEDDEWLAEQYVRVFERSGYQASVAAHAVAAIDMIDKLKPSAIVLDVLLAGYNAITLLHELQSYKDTAMIPIILCTNMAKSIKLSDMELYGVRLILDKMTMKPDDLVAAVRKVLE